jgi:hypothetical protein
MMELTNAIIQPDCNVKCQLLARKLEGTGRVCRVSYNANAERGQWEWVAKDVSKTELLAPAAVSSLVVVHLLL